MQLPRIFPAILLTLASPLIAQTTTTTSTVPISRVSDKYVVEGNIPYDKYPQTVLDVITPKDRPAPPHSPTEKLPAVIMFHGGGWIRTDKSTMSSFYNRFLAHGFIVCNVEYRMANQGGSIAPAAVQDALTAAKWFWDHADHYGVDKSRYIVTGASAGGHLALMVGMCTPEANLGPTSPQDYKIAAIVNGYGPTDVSDLLQRGTSWAKQWLPVGTPDRDTLAKRLSPITYVRKDIPPLLTVQGSNDTTVPVIQNETMIKALQAAEADADIHLAEGAKHGFNTPPTAWPDVEHQIFDVFLVKEKIIIESSK